MTRLLSSILAGAVLLATPLSLHAQSIELQAISDFTNRESGAVPYYLDIAGQRNVLAINAANPDYRNKFARAEHEFTGPAGIYDVTINAMGEIDGDGTYRLLINGIVQGVGVNPPVSVDYTIIEHTFQSIALSPETIIAVESNAVSNDTIPEGDGYAFARGRWRSVVLSVPEGAGTVITDDAIDLALSLSTVEVLAQDGAQIPVIVSVVNQSENTTATSPVVTFDLPDGVTFANGDVCSATRTGVTCEFPEIAPGDVANTSFNVDISQAGWLSISAAISSDQADSERSNNTATLTFESDEADDTVTNNNETNPATNTQAESTANSETGANNSTVGNQSASTNAGQSLAGVTTSTSVTSNTGGSAGGGSMGLVHLLVLGCFGLLGNRRVYRAKSN